MKTITIHNMVLPLALCVLVIGTACNPFAESKTHANCAVADDASNYIGKYLKHDGNAETSVTSTVKCIEQDLELDNGDGKDKGRVRWVACPFGRDCDEAGMV